MKYRKGDKITSPNIAIAEILAQRHIYYRHKLQNSGWTQNWSIASIRIFVNQGYLFYALRIKK